MAWNTFAVNLIVAITTFTSCLLGPVIMERYESLLHMRSPLHSLSNMIRVPSLSPSELYLGPLGEDASVDVLTKLASLRRLRFWAQTPRPCQERAVIGGGYKPAVSVNPWCFLRGRPVSTAEMLRRLVEGQSDDITHPAPTLLITLTSYGSTNALIALSHSSSVMEVIVVDDTNGKCIAPIVSPGGAVQTVCAHFVVASDSLRLRCGSVSCSSLWPSLFQPISKNTIIPSQKLSAKVVVLEVQRLDALLHVMHHFFQSWTAEVAGSTLFVVWRSRADRNDAAENELNATLSHVSSMALSGLHIAALHGHCANQGQAFPIYKDVEHLVKALMSLRSPLPSLEATCLFVVRSTNIIPLASMLDGQSRRLKVNAPSEVVAVSARGWSDAAPYLMYMVALAVGLFLCYGVSKNWISKRRRPSTMV